MNIKNIRVQMRHFMRDENFHVVATIFDCDALKQVGEANYYVNKRVTEDYYLLTDMFSLAHDFKTIGVAQDFLDAWDDAGLYSKYANHEEGVFCIDADRPALEQVNNLIAVAITEKRREQVNSDTSITL